MAHSAAPLYPIFLDIRGLPVLVVGGGAVAARKVADLVQSGASVVLVSPLIDAAIVALKEQRDATGLGSLRILKRKYRPADLTGKRLVFAATDNVGLNREICDAAQAAGALANCAAPPEAGIFSVPANVRRGAFCLAVSTGGASAALAVHWRKRLEKIAGPEWGDLVELLDKKRLDAKARVADPAARRVLLSALGQAHWAAKIKKLGVAEVERRMDAAIAKVERRAAQLRP
jgi:siroheme synthase-like protein